MLGTVPFLGSCVPVLTNFHGATIEIFFAILFPVSIRPHAFQLHSDVLQRIESVLKENVGICQVCESSLVSDGSSTIFYLKVKIQTSANCPLDSLRPVLQTLSRHGLYHQLNVDSWINQHELIIVVISKNFPRQQTTLSYLLGAQTCTDFVRFDETVEEICPWIEVKKKTLYVIGLDDVDIGILQQKALNEESNLTQIFATLSKKFNSSYSQGLFHILTKRQTTSGSSNSSMNTVEEETSSMKTTNNIPPNSLLKEAGQTKEELSENVEESVQVCIEDYLTITQLFHRPTTTASHRPKQRMSSLGMSAYSAYTNFGVVLCTSVCFQIWYAINLI